MVIWGSIPHTVQSVVHTNGSVLELRSEAVRFCHTVMRCYIRMVAERMLEYLETIGVRFPTPHNLNINNYGKRGRNK